MRSILLILTLMLMLEVAASPIAAQTAEFNLYKDSTTFSGECSKKRPCPELQLFTDPVNNTIGLACIKGASREDLLALHVAELESRLRLLLEARALKLRDGRYYIGVPVLTGKERQELAQKADQTAIRLVPNIASIVQQIRAAVPGREEMVFHLLWSRVMDRVWSATWERERGFGSELPAVQWIMAPEHRYAVGTNYWGEEIAVTWSRDSSCSAKSVTEHRLSLAKAAWGQRITQKQISDAQQLGLEDSEGNFKAFAYHSGKTLDALLNRLADQYSILVTHAYDYDSLSASLRVPVDDLFVILLHETAFSIFEHLSDSDVLQFPPALRAGKDASGCRSLVSLRLTKAPQPKDEIEYLFAQTGWRGNAETIAACNAALREKPDDSDVLFYLGLSLFQQREYQAALRVFQRVNALTPDAPESKHVPAHLWMATIYDVLGQREKALHEYREVVSSKGANMFVNYSGYAIGPMTAREWAEARIASPYVRQ